MRLLSTITERSGRAAPPAPQPRRRNEVERPLTDEQLAATQAIGARYEEVSGSLDGVLQLVRQLQSLEQMLGEIRSPIASEFEAHKADHAELIAARTAAEQFSVRLRDAEGSQQGLRERLAEVESELGDVLASAQTSAAAAEEAALEVDRLRSALAQAEGMNAELSASLTHVSMRMNELEQDNVALREQGQESDQRRREADAMLARATHQNVLTSEELHTLKGRAERATTEITRLSRVEAELTAQLAHERSRAVSAETTLANVQVEATKAMQALEEQLAAARWEVESAEARMQTAGGQNTRLNQLHAELSIQLEAANSEVRASQRRATELQTQLSRTDERIRTLEEELSAQRAASAGVESARATAIERAQQLARNLQVQETALRRAEEKMAVLRAGVERMETAERNLRQTHAEAIKGYEAELERRQTAVTIAEGALEAARRDRARLQMALLGRGDGDMSVPAEA